MRSAAPDHRPRASGEFDEVVDLDIGAGAFVVDDSQTAGIGVPQPVPFLEVSVYEAEGQWAELVQGFGMQTNEFVLGLGEQGASVLQVALGSLRGTRQLGEGLASFVPDEFLFTVKLP